MATWLWWTLGVTLWMSGACLVGLLVGAAVRLRDVPEALGTTRRPLVSLATWPPPALPASSVASAPPAPVHRRPAT